MIPRVRAAIATAILVGSATGAGAFTLLSLPASAPSGGFFECAIYNHSPSSGMQVTITILDELGLEVPSRTPCASGRGARSAFDGPSSAGTRPQWPAASTSRRWGKGTCGLRFALATPRSGLFRRSKHAEMRSAGCAAGDRHLAARQPRNLRACTVCRRARKRRLGPIRASRGAPTPASGATAGLRVSRLARATRRVRTRSLCPWRRRRVP